MTSISTLSGVVFEVVMFTRPALAVKGRRARTKASHRGNLPWETIFSRCSEPPGLLSCFLGFCRMTAVLRPPPKNSRPDFPAAQQINPVTAARVGSKKKQTKNHQTQTQ